MDSSLNFSKRFLNGIQDYNLTDYEIEQENVEYCGGLQGHELEYFKDYHEHNQIKDYHLFERSDTCFCGKEGLIRNYYIRKKSDKKFFDEDDYLILGSKCIQRFTTGIDINEDFFIDNRSECELTVYDETEEESPICKQRWDPEEENDDDLVDNEESNDEVSSISNSEDNFIDDRPDSQLTIYSSDDSFFEN